MKICYFGIYNPDYSRNRILINGLQQNGVEVIICYSRASGIFKYLDLIKKHWKIRKEYSALIVGYPGYQAIILAKLLTRKPVVFDAFTSLYDSMVSDRGIVKAQSARAFYYWALDWLALRLADIILLDTDAHIRYIAKEFSVGKWKMKRIWIGACTDVFNPDASLLAEREGPFTVIFFGTFIPLQGVEYIVRSAKLLNSEDIRFSIIGDGQEKKKIERLVEQLGVKNITFMDMCSQSELKKEIAKADVCLGIFGDTHKTQRVIPNKVYECLAMRKPVITADTPAARELLDEESVLFVKTADPSSLAAGILQLKKDRKTMEMLARNGYATLITNASPGVLGKELKDIIRKIEAV